jgi:dihydrofolate reductase
MRKLINSTYITLDGVIEDPAWTSPYFDDEASAFAASLTDAADAMLMGRVTYDGMSVAWPSMDENDPDTGAAYFNNVKKYVASTTLTDPTWRNTEVLQGDLVEAVAALKAQDGKDILQYGFGSVTLQLIKAGLVDEVRFWIHPVVDGVAAERGDEARLDPVEFSALRRGGWELDGFPGRRRGAQQPGRHYRIRCHGRHARQGADLVARRTHRPRRVERLDVQGQPRGRVAVLLGRVAQFDQHHRQVQRRLVLRAAQGGQVREVRDGDVQPAPATGREAEAEFGEHGRRRGVLLDGEPVGPLGEVARLGVVARLHGDPGEPRQFAADLGPQLEVLRPAQALTVHGRRALVRAGQLGQAADPVRRLQPAPPVAEFGEQAGGAGAVAVERGQVAGGVGQHRPGTERGRLRPPVPRRNGVGEDLLEQRRRERKLAAVDQPGRDEPARPPADADRNRRARVGRLPQRRAYPGLLEGIQDLRPEHLHGSEFHEEYLRTAPDPAGFAALVTKMKRLDGDLPQWTAGEIRAVTRLAILPGTTHTSVPQRADWLVPMVDEFLDMS